MKRNTNSLKKTFSRLRFLALAALICTLAATVFMLVESGLPGKLSAQQSDAISDTIKDITDVKDNDEKLETRSITVSGSLSGYTGRKSSLTIKLMPGGSISELDYTFSQNGIAHLDGTTLVFDSFGKTNLKFYVKADASVSRTVQVECYGRHPSEVTDLTVSSPLSVKQGVLKDIVLTDQNGDAISYKGFNTSVADQTVATLQNGKLLGLVKGHTTLKLTYGNLRKEFPVEVLDNPNFVAPTSFEYQSEFQRHAGTYFSLNDLVTALPAGCVFGADSARITVTSNSATNPLKQQSGPGVFYADSTGEATIIVTAAYNPNCKATIHVTVTEPLPKQLTIIGKDRILPNDVYKYTAFGDNTLINEVKWEVVSGHARLQDGALVPTGLGKVVLRASLIEDPSIYAELEITVSLFAQFSAFVRKILGHFSLFVILGVGIAVSCFLLMKRRKLWLPTAILGGFAASCASEMLQLPVFTTGRYATWMDVAIDFCGCIGGIILVLLAIGVATLILWRSKRKYYVKGALTALNIRTAFAPASRLPLLLNCEYSI